jgi:2-alkyl-3-oxoalkanoate reductase
VRVLIAGSTGVLGRRLVQQLSNRGHEVLGLTRNAKGDQTVRFGGGQPVRANLFESDEIVSAIESCDAIIHAATAIPKKQRFSATDWELNDKIRTLGVQVLTDVARRTEAKQLVFQSIVWVARPVDQSPFDEDGPVNPDDVTRSAAVAERMTLETGDEHSLTPTILRGG